MSYKLFITEVAEYHVDEAYQYYEAQQEGLGERFLFEVNATYKKIAEHPQYYSYISATHNFKDIGVRKFPFVVIYEIRKDIIAILAVFNTSRKPMY